MKYRRKYIFSLACQGGGRDYGASHLLLFETLFYLEVGSIWFNGLFSEVGW